VKSELFGHIKGAFPGADETKLGYFEQFVTGTIFLSEFGEDKVVAKEIDCLLRAVFTKPYTFRKMGSTTDILFGGTVILGVSNLAYFHESDFLSRVGGVPIINVPPLRERHSDIIPLAEFFLRRACDASNIPPKKLSSEVNRYLIKYNWPGNVRQLENMMNILATKLTRIIGPEYLDEQVRKYSGPAPASADSRPVPTPAELKNALLTSVVDGKAEKSVAACILFQLPDGTYNQASVKELDKLLSLYISTIPNYKETLPPINSKSGRRPNSKK
jgi:DNA-binding NtrC family response regulator